MKIIATLLALLASTVALASSTFSLPNDSVSINPNYGYTTTIATVYTKDADGNILNAKTYRGNSQFTYVNECQRADGPTYHCDVLTESNVVLVASDGTTATINLTIQSYSVLIRSGHNYWRHGDIVLSGVLTVQ